MTTLDIGHRAEASACDFLTRRGLTFVAQNYRCRLGEIDLIMQDKQTLVFVEVRYRQNKHFGDSIESVTWTKQQKIIRTAEHYLQHQHLAHTPECRFDVLGFSASDVTWIQDAFQLG